MANSIIKQPKYIRIQTLSPFGEQCYEVPLHEKKFIINVIIVEKNISYFLFPALPSLRRKLDGVEPGISTFLIITTNPIGKPAKCV